MVNALRHRIAKKIGRLASRKKTTSKTVRKQLRVIRAKVEPVPKERKNPIATTRAVTAGIDLFYSGKSAYKKRRLLAKFLRRTVTPFPEKMIRASNSTSDARVVTDLIKKVFFKNENVLKRKRTVLHEMAHFFSLGKNTQITGNALTGYFWRMKARFMPKKNLNPWIKDAEEIIAKGHDFENSCREHDTDMDLGHKGTSPARIGQYFGAFAAEKEKQWKKPASGFFSHKRGLQWQKSRKSHERN